ncbi:ultraviolet-B receptor UVR8-like [Corylus avellana]|uniref:ultraviolet-B receptor UVR8-like n=1 Tax=Corylus avellana TaxID=13451 RepID=UPI00286D698F|nr:ultraviolet-B receptor UVR8-like [Corylus avellana]
MALRGASSGELLNWDRRVVEKIEDYVETYILACTFRNVDDNFVWAFGVVYGPNDDGERSEYTPRLIKNLEGIKVKNVAAGLLHSACIDENGSLFIFGDRAVDKVGFAEVKNATARSMTSNLPYSEEVACGGYHTCVLTRSGELYTWGSNENGCLGIGSMDVFHLPERVQGPFLKSPVSKVSCGWKHTAAISECNIFTWGWGGSHGTFSEDGLSSGGQLGHGSDVDYIKPTMIPFGKNVKALQISCGFNHTGAILEYT